MQHPDPKFRTTNQDLDNLGSDRIRIYNTGFKSWFARPRQDKLNHNKIPSVRVFPEKIHYDAIALGISLFYATETYFMKFS